MAKKASKSASSQFSFLNRENAATYTKIQEAQFQEYCNLYGVLVDYFSRDIGYYDSEGRIRNLVKDGKYNRDLRDNTYFNGPERDDFSIVMPIRFLIDYGSDAYMFGTFGVDTSNDAKAYITKKQFSNNCLEFFGLPKTANITCSHKFKIINWQLVDCGEVIVPFEVEPGLVYSIKIKLNELDKIEVGDDFTDDIVTGFEFPVSEANPQYSSVIDRNKFIEYENFTATVTKSKTNKFGSGSLEIDFSFTLAYNSFKTNYNPHWDTLDTVLDSGKTVPITFAPKVGDIIRIRLIDDPEQYRDYTITFVNDTNLSKDGISPLLTNFCWECNITRRKPSHEIIDVPDTKQMEKGLEDILHKSEQEKVQDITREEEVYDYDKQFADVNDMLVDNIDAFKDGKFGSYGWIDNDE